MTGKRHIVSKICFLSFFVILTFAFISGANAQGDASSDIITNVEQRTGVKLPVGYTDKIRNFMINNKTLKREIVAKFTEDFIVNEMQADRGISRENQLLFIYCAIGYNYNQDFYTGDDGDDNRLTEFENVIDIIENCQTKYKNDIISYTQQRADESEERATNAINEIITGLNESLNLLKEFYYSYKQSPNEEELKEFKSDAREVISLCKKYNVDYKKILSSEILRFYGVE